MLKRRLESSRPRTSKNAEPPMLMVVHDGKGCPTEWNSYVRVVHRDGQETSDLACEFVWSHLGKDFDIIAYRVMGDGFTRQ